MPAVVKIKLADLDDNWIEELRKDYPNSELEVHITPDTEQRLSEASFWHIIEALDWNKTTNQAVLVPAIEKLSKLDVAQIYAFQELLAQKLYQLDTYQHALHIGDAAYRKEEYFSVDNFLYARACVVAHGKAVFQEVLEKPSEMPKDLTFEPLLRLASQAYQQKTGKKFVYLPSVSFETYSNEQAWANFAVV